MVNGIHIRLTVGTLLAAALLLPLSASAAPPLQALPVVTMEDALSRKLPTVAGLGWRGDSKALLASWKEPEAERETLVSCYSAASSTISRSAP